MNSGLPLTLFLSSRIAAHIVMLSESIFPPQSSDLEFPSQKCTEIVIYFVILGPVNMTVLTITLSHFSVAMDVHNISFLLNSTFVFFIFFRMISTCYKVCCSPNTCLCGHKILLLVCLIVPSTNWVYILQHYTK